MLRFAFERSTQRGVNRWIDSFDMETLQTWSRDFLRSTMMREEIWDIPEETDRCAQFEYRLMQRNGQIRNMFRKLPLTSLLTSETSCRDVCVQA